MAVNRLLLRCLHCQSTVPIARLQVGMQNTWLPSRIPADEYEAWLSEHSECDLEHSGLRIQLESENAESITIVHP